MNGYYNKVLIRVAILTILFTVVTNNALALSNEFFSNIYALKINEGFGPLSWGMHPNKAFETYPDLIEFNSNSYNKYIKGKGSDGIHLWMVRNNEDVLFAGIKMDVIKYQFIDNCLFSITAEKRCSADETPCDGEDLYNKFLEFARNTFGRPYEIGSTISKTKNTIDKFGGETYDKNISWSLDEESVSVTIYAFPDSSTVSVSIFSYDGYYKKKIK